MGESRIAEELLYLGVVASPFETGIPSSSCGKVILRGR